MNVDSFDMISFPYPYCLGSAKILPTTKPLVQSDGQELPVTSKSMTSDALLKTTVKNHSSEPFVPPSQLKAGIVMTPTSWTRDSACMESHTLPNAQATPIGTVKPLEVKLATTPSASRSMGAEGPSKSEQSRKQGNASAKQGNIVDEVHPANTDISGGNGYLITIY